VKLLSDSPASGRYRHLSANLAASVPYVLCAHFLSGIKTFVGCTVCSKVLRDRDRISDMSRAGASV
jgi:hypothetical protein